jgi:hypothetical protein
MFISPLMHKYLFFFIKLTRPNIFLKKIVFNICIFGILNFRQIWLYAKFWWKYISQLITFDESKSVTIDNTLRGVFSNNKLCSFFFIGNSDRDMNDHLLR